MKNAHFIRYRIVGVNQNYLLNLLKRNGISLYKIVKKEKNITELSIEFNEKQKFFAITENLCYNITRIGEYGFLYPLISLSKKIGVVIGLVVFAVIVVLADKIVFEIDYTGTGALYKNQAEALLADCGIKKYSVITTSSLRTAENKILSSSDKFSFVSLKKSGGRLKVNLTAAKFSGQVLDTSKKQVVSSADGVVESVKVYRGTAVVGVGDTVKIGDVLIDGYNIIKDARVETFALGTVTVITEKTFVFSGEPNQEESMLILAKENVGEEIIDENCTYTDGEYTVKFTCRIKIK